MSSPHTPLDKFLHADELRHISPLKMRTMFGEALRAVPVCGHSTSGFIFIMPRAASQWDSAKYPSVQHSIYVALPAYADDALVELTAATVLAESAGESFVVKTIERKVIDALQRTSSARMPLRYQLALLTFTPTRSSAATTPPALSEHDTIENTERAVPSVRSVCCDHIPNDARALLDAHNVYSATELNTMFADGVARCWLRYANDAPVAVALTFANSKTQHEIGSLYVRADARRAGHAEALVRSALHDLATRELKVRYVVDAENTASISLATRCGLQETFRAEHWLSN